MNIFMRELKANLKSLIIWGVIVVLFVMVGLPSSRPTITTPRCSRSWTACRRRCWPRSALRAFNLTTVTRLFRDHVRLLCAAALHRRRHVGQRHHLQGRARQDGRVLADPAGDAQPRGHRQDPGGAGQLHRPAAHHLGRVARQRAPLPARRRLLPLPGPVHAGAVHPATDLPGRRHLPGLRHEAVQTGRFGGGIAIAGHLLSFRHLGAEQGPGLSQVLSRLSSISMRACCCASRASIRPSWRCRWRSSWRAWRGHT